MFEEKNLISEVALNILKKRYFREGESTWEDVTNRVINYILEDEKDLEVKELTKEMILNRYFLPNSPTLVNSGNKNAGLSACYVVDFKDDILEIYKTKLDFALIARKGGGCGTYLGKLRPEDSIVSGSTHKCAGGPTKFANTISHDMNALTQSGFREMAIMFVQDIRHPDIVKFITAKVDEGKLSNANISVLVTNEFMNAVEEDLDWQTYFKYSEDSIQLGNKYKARELFNLIVEHAWKNGEPGVLFYEKMNENSPYKYTGQEILCVNPCGEEPLPFNGVCNLGNLDISKFLDEDNTIDLNKLETSVTLGIRFLDKVIDRNSFPTEEISKWVKRNRPIGLGIMGLADYFLLRKVAYGPPQSLEELRFIMQFIYKIAENESISLGKSLGIPKECKKLPIPRRNITLLTCAPTGTTSLIADCSNGIEPIFSEITIRNDKTGTYTFENGLINEEYFKCAVSINGTKEVSWEEHLAILNAAQEFCDSGVSKTINCPNLTHKETIYKIFMEAWKSPFIKGITVYRNSSRDKEVLSPKNLKKDLCPICGKELIKESNCKRCIDLNCGFSFCEI